MRKELHLMADLKTELEDAYKTADSIMQAIISGYLNELPEAEESFTPVLDSQDSRDLKAYVHRVRDDCGIAVASPVASPVANPPADSMVNAPATAPTIPTITQLFNDFCIHKTKTGKWKGDRADLNIKAYGKPLSYFTDLTKLTDIRQATKAHVRSFKDRLLSDHNKSTPSNYFNKTAAFFAWVMQETDYLEHSVFKQVGGLSRGDVKGALPVSTEDTRKILRIVPSEFTDVFKLYFYTGLRSSEPFNNMDWLEVDSIKCLRITDSKTKASNRTIPLHSSIEHLYGLNVKQVADTPSKLNTALKAFTERSVTLYSFRHGIADRLRQIENCPDGLRYAITGHAQEGTTDQHYGDGWTAQIGRMKKVIDQLPEL